MAAPTLRGVGAFGSGTTSCTAAVPTGGSAPQSGDAMYIFVESTDSTTTAGTPDTPSGWTKLGEWTAGAGATGLTTLTIFGKMAGASETDVSITGVGNHCSAAMIVVASHGLSHISATVVGEPSDNGTGTSGLSTNGINCRADSFVILGIALSDDANDTTNVDTVANANLASITEQIDQTVTTGAGGGLALYTATCAGTTTGATTWNHDTAERALSVHLAVPPTGVTGPKLIQQAGALQDSGTSVVCAYPQNVAAGDLLIVAVTKYSNGNDPFLVGDISMSAGTATLGTPTLDVNLAYNYSGTNYLVSALYSIPVTGAGSCTITVGGALAASSLVMCVSEWSGLDVGASRVEDSDSGSALTGAPTTATATSAGAAAFVGMVGTQTVALVIHAPGADYTTLYESENGAVSMTGSAIYRIVSSGTTDAADWTLPTGEQYACVVAVYKVATGSQSVTGSAISSGLALHVPTVVPEGAIGTTPITTGNVVRAPTIHPGAVVVIAASIAAASALSVPTPHHVPAWPLRVSSNSRYIEDSRFIPFLINGTAVWSLTHNLTLSEAKTVMDALIIKGINALIVQAPDAFDESGVASDPVSNDKQGNQPFTSNDISQPVEAYWSHVDDVLAAAKDRGLAVFFFPMYLGHTDTQGFRDTLGANSLANATTYGGFIGARYGSLGNLVWIHGGDFAPTTWANKIRAIQDAIIANASIDQLHGTHWDPGANPWDYTADFAESRFDILGVYTDSPMGLQTNDTYNHSPTKPAYLIEGDYENETGGSDNWVEPYRAIFSGALGHFSGNNPLWYCGDNNGGWAAALNSTGYTRLANVWKLFNGRQWWKLIPSRDAALMTSGDGDPDTDTGCQGARTADEKLAMIFFPSQLTVTVSLPAMDAGGAGSSIQADWFNTRTGAITNDGTYGVTGTHNFTPPASTSEYVLILTSDVAPATNVTITGAAIASGLAVRAPTIRYAVSGATITSGARFAPTIAPGPVAVAGTTRGSTLSLAVPTITVGPVSVTAAHLAAATAVNGPNVSQGGATQNITAAARGSAATLASPSTAYRINGGTQASMAQTFVPSAAYHIAGAAKSSGVTLSAPTITTSGSIAGAHISSGGGLFAPTAHPGAVAVGAASCSSTSALSAPLVSIGGVGLIGGYRAGAAALNPPSIHAGSVAVMAARVTSTLSVASLRIAYVVRANHIGSGAVLSVATARYQVTAAHLGPAIIHPPGVSGGGVYYVTAAPGAGQHNASLVSSETHAVLMDSRTSANLS